MKVKIKKIHPDAIIPEYKTEGSSGFDLHALEEIVINTQETVLIRTGLAIQVPKNYEIQIRPRSGLSLKTSLRISNSPGTIDSDFLGEVKIIATNTGIIHENVFTDYINHSIIVKKGDRIAQGVICPVIRAEFEEVEILDETERGDKGFGSTGV